MTTDRPAGYVRRIFAAGLIGVLMLCPGSAVGALAVAGFDASGMPAVVMRAPGPDDAESETTEPETTEPETTEPETTEPVDSAPADLPEDQDSDDVNEAVTVGSLLVFAAIVVVAAWWMVRRQDEDNPRQPPTQTAGEPLPGHDLL